MGQRSPGGYLEKPVPGVVRWGLALLASLGQWASSTSVSLRRRRRGVAPPVAVPGGAPVVIRGTALPTDAKTYLVLPFEVAAGTTRVEVDYDWRPLPPALPENPLTQTVLDLGLWDEKGYRSADGFRGWSGSRARKIFVQADAAERGYRPGPVNPGVWYAELGLAAIGPTGADWTVKVRAVAAPVGEPPVARPVDRAHVAKAAPGWYHGDFHMHAWHSNPKGPTPDEFVAFARAASLDFTPVTEYVVGHHWDQYGDVQEANPDLVIWPGREIVTYFGHVQSLGETPGFIEYRHGFEDVHIRDIQTGVRAGGALFQINHPTTFPGPLFQSFCRGCAWELGDEIDWDAVDTMEVLTGPVLVDPEEFGLPDVGMQTVNPFFRPAVDLWEGLLNRGHRITAVCGSDDKKGDKLGSCATSVYAEQLSRPALVDAIRAGRAYVRTRGVAHSPALEMVATTADGQRGIFGDTLVASAAQVTVTVTGGAGQALRVVRNGDDLATVPVMADPFTHTFTAERVAGEGPLGTWYRVETFDARSRTTIGNPIFLGDR
ncbi:MAG: CehA/McbA family metallohydrolase [Actinomycetota bacterium]|nr:CehA/McbA family metallohydrolase [Actinomycetota bacterium]